MGMPVLRENPWPAPAGDPSASRALLDAIIESLPFRVWACDREGRCILQNSQSVQDFGPFVGQPTQLLPLPPEQMARWHASFDRALAG